MGQSDDVEKSVVHYFDADLRYSNAMSHEPAWTAFYRSIWPDLRKSIRGDAADEWQRSGIDRILFLPNGRQITIDEKKRRVDYKDIELEEWSVYYRDRHPRNKIGWTLDPNKRCDFVAYAVVPARKCYLLPFELLRLTFTRHRANWTDGRFPSVVSNRNNGYVTRGWGIPWPVLSAALAAEMRRQFGAAEPLALPQPVINGTQLEFGWRRDV